MRDLGGRSGLLGIQIAYGRISNKVLVSCPIRHTILVNYTVMAYIVMVYIVKAYTLVAHTVTACTVMA